MATETRGFCISLGGVLERAKEKLDNQRNWKGMGPQLAFELEELYRDLELVRTEHANGNTDIVDEFFQKWGK